MNKFILSLILLSSIPTMAAYQRLALCAGLTENNAKVRAALFVDLSNTNEGFAAVSIEGGQDFLGATKIDWKNNPQGFPRFFENEFDLDIVIAEKTVSHDDIIVGDEYIPQLQCRYTPKNE